MRGHALDGRGLHWGRSGGAEPGRLRRPERWPCRPEPGRRRRPERWRMFAAVQQARQWQSPMGWQHAGKEGAPQDSQYMYE